MPQLPWLLIPPLAASCSSPQWQVVSFSMPVGVVRRIRAVGSQSSATAHLPNPSNRKLASIGRQAVRRPHRRKGESRMGPQASRTSIAQEKTRTGQDQTHQKNLSRPSAEEIYRQVATNARQELGRSTTSLCLSGFGGGAFMGLSALGTAIAIALLGPSSTTNVISRMF